MLPANQEPGFNILVDQPGFITRNYYYVKGVAKKITSWIYVNPSLPEFGMKNLTIYHPFSIWGKKCLLRYLSELDPVQYLDLYSKLSQYM